MNNPLVVGLDCDGVLRDFDGRVIELAKQNGVEIQEPLTWGYLNKYKIDGITIGDLIWDNKRWLDLVHGQASVLDGAFKAYTKMCNNPDIDVRIVTSQREGTEHITDKWLSEHKFVIHSETIYSSEKHTIADLDLLIDDHLYNLRQAEMNNIQPLLVETIVNKDIDFKPRVKNLDQAYKWIKKNFLHYEMN